MKKCRYLCFIFLFTYNMVKAQDFLYKDSRNKMIKINKTNKIISLDPFATQLLFTLEAYDKLSIALFGGNITNKNNIHKLLNIYKFSGDFFFAKDLNIEELLKVTPDLVIAKEDSTNYKKVENANIPVFTIFPESIELLIKDLKQLAILLNKNERYLKLENYYNNKIEQIKKNSHTISNSKKIYFSGSQILHTYGNKSYQNFLVELIGAKSVTNTINTISAHISFEQLIAYNPDIIIIPFFGQKALTEITTDARYKILNAVKNKKIYILPSYFMEWTLPVPETILGALFMQKIIYPDITNINLIEEIKYFYDFVYNYKIPSTDLEKMLEYFK